MTRRLSVRLPDVGDGRPRPLLRLLAVADEIDAALERPENHARLGMVDVIVGCGDLEPDHLAFLADSFRAPLVYVRGNHDRGGGWEAGLAQVPEPLADGRFTDVGDWGMRLLALSWPAPGASDAQRDERSAWWQVLRPGFSLHAPSRPAIVVSHVPPRGSGDDPNDPYHTGFAAYRWLLRRLKPVLWLHGHTPLPAASAWKSQVGPSTVVNVTGSVLIELDGSSVDTMREGTSRP